MDAALKKEYLRRHWILWNWLAEHPEAWKWDGLRALGFEDDVDNDCYLCEIYLDSNCSDCPLALAGNVCGGQIKATWYSKYVKAITSKTRQKYALLIRDVVERPEDI